MKIAGLVVAGILSLGGSMSMAHGLHVDAKEIAAVLNGGSETPETYRDEVRKLRAESEKQHRLGKHHDAQFKAQQTATRSTK